MLTYILPARFAIAFMLLLPIVLPARVAFADPDNRPIVVLREDDARSSWNVPLASLGGMTALAYGKSKQIPITWGVITSFSSYGYGLTWAQLTDYINNAGGELASHSSHHAAMSSTQDYIDEMISSKAAIEANVPGYTCTTFLQPGPWAGNAYMNTWDKLMNPIGQGIQATYSQSQAYLGRAWRIGNSSLSYGMTSNFSLDYPASSAAVQATLDVVSNTPGAVFVFQVHGVQEIGGTDTECAQGNVLKAFLDRCADLRDSGKIRLMSLRDAYSAVFSADINRVPDPGFEYCNPGTLNPVGPWTMIKDATIDDTSGIGGTRCLRLPANGDYAKCNGVQLAPGRYTLSWSQRPVNPEKMNKPVYLSVTGWCGSNYRSLVTWLGMSNTSEDWQQKTVLLLAPSGFPTTNFGLLDGSQASWNIDDVSLVSAPVDPNVSPSNVTVTPTPNCCTISWDTPTDPEVTSMVVCYGTVTHPLTKDGPTVLRTIMAKPGTRQQVVVSPFNWSSSSYFYFSLFAVKNGQGSPPELATVVYDSSPPTTPQVQAQWQPGGTCLAGWNSQDPESGVYQYSYAVGTIQNADGLVPWTMTNDTSVTLSGLPQQQTLYVSVKAQNPQGNWSSVGKAALKATQGITDALESEDGSYVLVTGIITAIFKDDYYIEAPSRANAIRIHGNTTAYEGDSVTVHGVIETDSNMERMVLPDPPPPESGRGDS